MSKINDKRPAFGFTLLEIVMVLVIIGVITAMSFSTIYLIAISNEKAEMGILKKMRSAANTYYARSNVLPPLEKSNNFFINMNVFMEDELLLRKDIKSRSFNNVEYIFARCSIVPIQNDKLSIWTNKTGGFWFRTKEFELSRNVCIVPVNNDNENNKNDYRTRIACIYESSIDDNDARSGSGRFSFLETVSSGSAQVPGTNSNTKYGECSKYRDNNYYSYAVLAF